MVSLEIDCGAYRVEEMRIIAYKTSTGNREVILEESTSEVCKSAKLDELFSFLLEDYEDTIRVCWSLDDTVAPLLKLVGEQRCRRLYETHRCYYAPFNIFFIEGKVFSVTHIPSKQQVSLYELEQYYPELSNSKSLEEIEYLGMLLVKTLAEMGLQPTKLTSPVAIYEQCILNHLSLPTVGDMPEEAALFAAQCGSKLWIECFQIGYWE